MAIKKYFPAQEDTEKVFLLIRRHWFTYSIFWLLAFLMILPVIAVIIIWTLGLIQVDLIVGNIIILAGGAYMLGLLGLMLYGFVDYYLDVYIVTDRRIVDIRQNGFFKREISELYLQEVQDVNAKVIGFFPTVLHFGEVIIQTAGEIDNFIFNAVPHPYQISKTIMDLHESIIRDLSAEDNIPHPHHNEKMSEKELSKGRFDADAIEATKEFFKDEGEQNKHKTDPTPSKKENKETEDLKEIPQDLNNKKDLQNSKSKKDPSDKEGILEEGREIDIV